MTEKPVAPESKQYAFLYELFGDNPKQGLWIQLWTKADKRSHYFATSTTAAAFAEKNRRDLYVAVSLAPKKFPTTKRCPAVESAGIAGVWADIDVNGGPENKTGAAPDFQAAEQLAFSVLEPTLVINSGYGLQAWWLFEDGPWFFATKEEREQAARLSAGWIAMLRQRAKAEGFNIDATQDLARLMRLPGTINGKGGHDAFVDHYYEDGGWTGPRHDRDHMMSLALAASPSPTAVAETLQGLVGEFELRPEAEPAYGKMSAALANSPMFAKTWEHNRNDHPNWTLSEYDLSLASQVVHMEWTDQEVADLLVAHRRRHGDMDKALRPDYIRMTLSRARRDQQTKAQETRVEEALDNLATMGHQEAPDPDAVMAEFNAVINSPKLTVKELIQDGEDPKQARYRLIVEPGGKEVPIGPATSLFNPDTFREAFGVVTGHIVMPVKRDIWLKALQALLNVRQVHVAPDDTPAGQVVEWLGRYLGERMIDDQSEAARRREPFTKDGEVYVYASSFATFVTRSLGRRISDADLKQMLKAAGFVTRVVSFHTDRGRATSRSYYCVPKEQLE